MAANINLAAFKRVSFVTDFAIVGPNYTGAAFALHIRNRPGDTGSPLVTLGAASAGSEGVSVAYDPAYLYVKDGVEIIAPASVVTVQINEATLEALSLNNPTDTAVALAYDLHITPSGDIKRVALFGSFAIYPGVTI